MKKLLLFIVIITSINVNAQIDTIGIFKATGLTLFIGEDSKILDTDAEIVFISYLYKENPFFEFVVKDSKSPYSDIYVLPLEYMKEQRNIEKTIITGGGFNRSSKQSYNFWIGHQFSDNIEKKWTKEKGWVIVEGYDEWGFIFYTKTQKIYYIAKRDEDYEWDNRWDSFIRNNP